MAQDVSTDFKAAVTADKNNLSFGVLISFDKTINMAFDYFTIGTSTIGGPDVIKGAGSASEPGFFDKYQYTDYSEYALGFSVTRRLGELPYGTFMALADVSLDNTSKLFLPMFDDTIGEYILPSRPIKLAMGFDSETVQVFSGFSEMPRNSLTARETKISAFDAFDFIDTYESTETDMFEDEYVHDMIETLLNEAGFVTGQYEIDQSLRGQIGYFDPRNKKLGDIFRTFCEAEQAIMFVDENGIIQWWNRQHLNTTSDNSDTLGVTANSGSNTSAAADEIRLSQVTADTDGLMDSLSIRAWLSGAGTAKIRGVVYSDDGGAPDELLAYTDELEIDDTVEAEQTINFDRQNSASLILESGLDYWIGVAYETPTGGVDMRLSIDGTADGHVSKADTYSDGILDPMVTATDESGILDCYLTYRVTDYALSYSNMTRLEFDVAPIINSVRVVAKPREVQPEQLIWKLGTALEVPAGGSLQVFADLADDYGPLPTTSVDEPVEADSGVSSYFRGNFAFDGSGADATDQLSVDSDYLFGTTYRVTMDNANATKPVFITEMEIYGTPARVIEEVDEIYRDQNSIDDYGLNPTTNGEVFTIDNDTIQTSDEAYALAYNLVNFFSTPLRRYKLNSFVAPHIQFGDLLTIDVADLDELKTFYVTGIENKLIAGQGAEQTLYAEEREITTWFTIGESVIGGSDPIAP